MDNETKIIILGTTLGLVLLFNLVVYLCERKGIDLFPDDDAKGLKNRIKRVIGKISYQLQLLWVLLVSVFTVLIDVATVDIVWMMSITMMGIDQINFRSPEREIVMIGKLLETEWITFH